MTRRDAICRAMCQRDPCCLGYPDHNANRFTPCRGFGSMADRAEVAVREWDRQAASLKSAASFVYCNPAWSVDHQEREVDMRLKCRYEQTVTSELPFRFPRDGLSAGRGTAKRPPSR